jgi:O-succinylbenzoate synthase
MRIDGVELIRLRMPLVTPFRASVLTMDARDLLLLRVMTPASEGWGECGALPDPVYSEEYVDGAADVLRKYLVPAVMQAGDVTADQVAPLLARFKGHRMAKAALEMAVLDAELRAGQTSLATALGSTRDSVPCGVSVGIAESIPRLLDVVVSYLDQGYVRIKLKIEPGWDVEPVRAVRERFGDDVLLQVDANAAYTIGDAEQLAKLDPFDLLLIEQPLDEEDLLGHAELARHLRTPICLDESITSAKLAADAITLRACRIVNIKASRVGGYLEARRVHDVCQANDVPVWCGDMIESGIGRAADLALASLPGFTLPGDTSASDRYFRPEITEPFLLVDGHLPVPTGPGIGVTPIPERLAELTLNREFIA